MIKINNYYSKTFDSYRWGDVLLGKSDPAVLQRRGNAIWRSKVNVGHMHIKFILSLNFVPILLV